MSVYVKGMMEKMSTKSDILDVMRYSTGVATDGRSRAGICRFAACTTVCVAMVWWTSSVLGKSSETETPLGPEGTLASWRLPCNDGINCLYIQLRLLGYSGDYEALWRQISGGNPLQTLESLALAAGQVGFKLRSRKLTFSELTSARKPMIVHMEEEGVASSGFSLFLFGTPQSVALIEGPSARYIETPVGHFGRAWTGYALVPEADRDLHALTRRGTVALLIGLALTHLLDDRKRALRSFSASHG
jgi:hypothetical protein